MEWNGLVDRQIDDVIDEKLGLVRISDDEIIQRTHVRVTVVWFDDVQLRRATISINSEHVQSIHHFIGIFLQPYELYFTVTLVGCIAD